MAKIDFFLFCSSRARFFNYSTMGIKNVDLYKLSQILLADTDTLLLRLGFLRGRQLFCFFCFAYARFSRTLFSFDIKAIILRFNCFGIFFSYSYETWIKNYRMISFATLNVGKERDVVISFIHIARSKCRHWTLNKGSLVIHAASAITQNSHVRVTW